MSQHWSVCRRKICDVNDTCAGQVVYIFTVRNEVAKVMLHLSVSHSVHRGGGWCAIPACIAGGIPACLAGGVCSGGCLFWGRGSAPGGGGACFHGVPAWRPPWKQTAAVADGMHPTGMHSCYYWVGGSGWVKENPFCPVRFQCSWGGWWWIEKINLF